MWNIIQHPDLSDQSPSTLLSTLLGMIPTGEKPDKWFQGLYLLKLPSELRGPLSTLKWEDVRQMGEHADILWGGTPPQQHQLYTPCGRANPGNQGGKVSQPQQEADQTCCQARR